MRRIYRKPYNPPQYAAKKRSKDNKASTPLVQPEWDNTIHDLKSLKASPEEVLKRKLSRTSHNQMGMTLLVRSAHSGQQERYTPSASHNQDLEGSDASDADSEDSYEHSRQQQQQHHHHYNQQRSQHHQQQQQEEEEEAEGLDPDAPHLTAEQLHHHLSYQQQQQQHQSRQRNQHTSASASVLAQYDTSAVDSDDDVCQWQSPIHGKLQQQRQLQRQLQEQQQRNVLQDIRNSAQYNTWAGQGPAVGAVKHHKHSSWHPQQQQQQQQEERQGSVQAAAGTVTVGADALQTLLDKIALLEEQLQSGAQQQQANSTSDLQQQLAQSQQQLAFTQQELSKLQQEHRQYVAHTSTLLTQLQTQVQQLLTNYNTLPPLPSLRAQQQQQQAPLLQAYSSRLRPAAAEAVADERWHTAAGAGVRGDSSSSSIDKLLQISEFIKKQLQDQEAAAAVPAVHVSSSSKSAAATVGRVAGPATSTGSACSSPSRKKSHTCFTPAAVADTVVLPSYAAMRQQGRAGVTNHTAMPGSPAKNLQPGYDTGLRSSGAAAGRVSAAAAAGLTGDARNSWQGVSNSASISSGSIMRDKAHVHSPQRLQTTHVPQPLAAGGTTGTNTALQQQQQQGVPPSSRMQTGGVAPSQPQLSVKAPTARAAAVPPHVWEAELSSPRPQQMQVPAEHMQYHLSNAAAESIGQQVSAASVGQLPNDLAALLRDLGLASLELTAGGTQTGDGLLLPAAVVGSSREGKGVGSSAMLPLESSGAVGGASGRGNSVPVVVSEAATAPAAATAGGMLRYSRGDGVLTGVEDVDWGLQEGLPMAAVSRVYTAAGCVSDRDEAAGTRPRVLKEGLKGNMCFRDHLRAAAAAAASGAKGGGGS